TIIVWIIADSAAELYEKFNPYLNKTSLYRKNSFEVYLPFDTSLDGHVWLSIFPVIPRTLLLQMFITIDTALTGSLIHLISQTMIVNEAFKYVDKDIDENQTIRNIFLIKEIRLVKCVNELQRIYRGFEILEEMCSWQILIQCGLATLLLCCLTYIIPLVSTSLKNANF
ncbi:unnamed protein product, partial [Diabrotica balteata]